MDYQRQLKEKADSLIALSYKLMESTPESDHIPISALNQLGIQIYEMCEQQFLIQEKLKNSSEDTLVLHTNLRIF